MTNSVNTKTHTDIKKLIWIEQFIPKSVRPYAYLMRIDRPIGVWLLLLPGLWGIVLASGGLSSMSARHLYYIFLFIIGSILMRGAGCVINDLWDRDLDKMVERTKGRPLASGLVTVKQGVWFLATLLLIGFVILLQFNITTIILGCLTVPLIISYPLMKRITWWPQAFLGLTFNFSALMGWSAVNGDVSASALLLYGAGIFWTLGYDTIYAHQDKDDDVMAGIKSTALKFGDNSKIWVGGFYALSLIFIIEAAYIANGLSYLLMFATFPALHLVWQIKSWKPDNQTSSLKIFRSNRDLGLMVLVLFLIF